MNRRLQEKFMQGDVLRADHVTVSFGGVQALRDVSVRVGPGEAVGLIGPNGAGKTTLFQAIGGYVPVDAGRITLGENDVSAWPAHRRATAGMARTFQRLELFGNLTVIENLLVAAEVHAAATSLGDDLLALPRAARSERGLREQVTDIVALIGLEWAGEHEAGTLPLGAGRMLEIGRALCTQPHLLLLDEPSSGLDQRESHMLASLIRRVRSERSVGMLLIEHDVAFVADLCDRLVVLDAGSVIADATPADVLASDAVRVAYLGAEAS